METIGNANEDALVGQRSIVSGIMKMLVTMVPQNPPIATVARIMTNLNTNMQILTDMKSAFVDGVALTLYRQMPAYIKKVDKALSVGATYIANEMRNRIDCSFCGSMNVRQGEPCGARLVGSLHDVLASKIVKVNQHTSKHVYFKVQGSHAIHTDANMSGLYKGASRVDWGISQLDSEQLQLVLRFAEIGTVNHWGDIRLNRQDRQFRDQLRDAAASL